MTTRNETNHVDYLGEPSIDFRTSTDVIHALRIKNQIILPIFITFGIITNTFTLCIACRPKLRDLHINLYIQVLSLTDLLGFILRLPIAFDNEYCRYTHYSMAFYMTHFGWLIVNYFRAMSSYVLVNISYDRFKAIWFPHTFKDTLGTNVVMKRLVLTALWLFLTVYIPWACLTEVSGNDRQWYTTFPNNSAWFTLFKYYSLMAITGLPGASILGLSIGISIGLFKKIYKKKRISEMNQVEKKRFYRTIAVLTMNSLYIVCCFPYMVATILLNDMCNSNTTYSKETVRYLVESLSSSWYILNTFIFFLINNEYKTELWQIFKTFPLVKNCINNSIIN